MNLDMNSPHMPAYSFGHTIETHTFQDQFFGAPDNFSYLSDPIHKYNLQHISLLRFCLPEEKGQLVTRDSSIFF